MLGVKCVKITTAAIPFFVLFLLLPIILKVSKESGRPLVCYNCWADKLEENETSGWDRPWCLLGPTTKVVWTLLGLTECYVNL